MEKNILNGKGLWHVTGGKTNQQLKPASRGDLTKHARAIANATLAAVLVIGAMVSPLCAQSYPNKPMRIIVPMAPGGLHDILGRFVGQKLAERLSQPVVPENRGGAGGNVGAELAAKARPDGYTIVLVSQGVSTSPSLYKKLNYDPIKDFAPISLTAQTNMVVVVRPSLPFQSLKDLIDYAKANPGKLGFGSGGTGGVNHLTGELLKSLAKIDILHVPYKSAGPALVGMMSGEIDIMLSALPSALPHIQAGKVRALAMLSQKRVPSLPNVPTAKEAGIDNFEVSNWYGILAPAGTPRDIINLLNAEWIKIVTMPDTLEMMQKAEVEPLWSTPEQFAGFLRAETVRWSKIVKEANIAPID